MKQEEDSCGRSYFLLLSTTTTNNNNNNKYYYNKYDSYHLENKKVGHDLLSLLYPSIDTSYTIICRHFDILGNLVVPLFCTTPRTTAVVVAVAASPVTSTTPSILSLDTPLSF
jgi:hypothetical protein